MRLSWQKTTISWRLRTLPNFGEIDGSIGRYIFASWVPPEVFRSSDDGLTWDTLRIPPTVAQTGKLFSLCVSGTDLVTLTTRGLFVSSDSGETWAKTHADSWESRRTFLAANGKDIIAGADDDGFLRSSDCGLHWIIVDPGDLMDKYLVGVAIQGNRVYAVMEGKRGWHEEIPSRYLYRTDDDGKNWKVVSTGFVFVVPHGQDLFSLKWRRVGYSSDGGETWKDITDGLISELTSIAFSGNEIFIGTWEAVSGAGG